MRVTWRELVVLDLATEDEYWLNEVQADEVIRATLPKMVRAGSIEIREDGQLIDRERAQSLLVDGASWLSPAISFYATQSGRDRYFGLSSGQMAELWRDAVNAGYPSAVGRLAPFTRERSSHGDPGEL